MHIYRRWRLFLSLLVAMAYAAPALAQQPAATDPSVPAAAAPAAKKPPKHKPSAAPASTAEPATAVAGGVKPTLLGQYGDWGAYAASPGGKKVCFAIAKPATSETNPPGKSRNPSYVGPARTCARAHVERRGRDRTADGHAAEEAHLIEAMRSGQNAVLKGMSAKGTRSTDIFSLKGFGQALDRTGQDCK